MNLASLIESLLLEGAALTPGSQRVMNDKKLVSALAQTIRDDVAINPASFPPGSKNNFKKAPDEEVAHWFLENLDSIERAGYDGVVYTPRGKEGTHSDWIVRRYIAGSHNWEDITGVLNMNLFDWYALKNRGALDANHQQISKFNSIRQIGSYMVTHYKDELEKTRDAAKNAAKDKLAKTIKIVDNDDYRIFCSLNRIAGCKMGRGTQWCTANSTTDQHYHRYSAEAMLFQMYPKNPEMVNKKSQFSGKVSEGEEKYQFGADNSYSFKDIADDQVPKNLVKTKFPYLYKDLTSALMQNKGKIEAASETLKNDPTLQTADTKVKQYDIDEEIRKLHKFVDLGYFTDEVRPPKAEEPAPEQLPQAPQENPMESIKALAQSMLEDITLGHIVQQFKPANDAGEESPLTHGDENLDGENEQDDMYAVDEEDAMPPPVAGGEVGAQAQTGGTLGGGGMGSSGGSHYAPGTAPTMPESINQGNMMENIDKDVAAMLKSLKKYDKLVESVAPVLMARPVVVAEETSQQRGQANDQKHAEDAFSANRAKKRYDADEAWAKSKGKLKEDDVEDDVDQELDEAGPAKKDVPAFLRKEKGGDWKTSKEDLEKEKDDKISDPKTLAKNNGTKVDESAEVDPEILAWMGRFAKLGNMKGYGR